ncbi:snRNA-activating protein complex subunit 2 [Labeo rohita]|uniref:snRNA-activating protein complex subunit 2 n=1 Tax=Labeo rohita TaxID=84645 RepID=UPI0021E1F0DB|nr:snRNA-activating protein complex subunit 2 [Labeo rohita]
MLVIAAVEPCGLLHSEPPHPIIQTSAFSSVQSPKTPSRPSASYVSPNASVSTPSVQPDCSSNAVDHLSQFNNASSSSPLVPEKATPRSSQMTGSESQLRAEAEPAVSSPISTGAESLSVSPNKHSQVQLQLLDHDYLCKEPRMLKCVVNFDKIYQYLSDIDSKTCNSALTSMECAVLLDMLMCLPEELPLLDCKELQHHLLQLHSQLSKPVKMPAISSNTDRDVLQANVADSTALTQKLTEPAKDNKDWATATTCPLNPLLVPVTLLKRPSLDSEK